MPNLKNKRILKILLLVTFLIVIVVGYYFFSLNFPGSNISIQGLKDRNSHYYQTGKLFKYGDYEFTLNTTLKSLGEKEDCPSVAKNAANNPILPWLSSMQSTQKKSWQQDYDNALTACNLRNQEKDQKELMDVQMNVKNISKTIKNIEKDYFKIEVDGKTLDSNKDVDFYLKDNIGPNEDSSNALNTKVNKNQKEVKLLITLPDKATQIVNLK